MPKKKAPLQKKATAKRKTVSRKKTVSPRDSSTAQRHASATRSENMIGAKSRSTQSRTQKTASAEAPLKARFSRQQLEAFRKQLLDLRDRLVDRINFLARENLNNSQREASGDLSNYGIHMADQGTDNFDREFALNVVSNEQDVLYEIDEALQRIEAGTYGICEMTGRPIEIERLRAVPYTRFCLAAQTQLEKGRKHFRPFSTAGLPSVES